MKSEEWSENGKLIAGEDVRRGSSPCAGGHGPNEKQKAESRNGKWAKREKQKGESRKHKGESSKRRREIYDRTSVITTVSLRSLSTACRTAGMKVWSWRSFAGRTWQKPFNRKRRNEAVEPT